MFVDVCDEVFLVAFPVLGWGFFLQNQITRQRFPHQVRVSSAKMFSSGLGIYEENALLRAKFKSIKHYNPCFPLSKRECGVRVLPTCHQCLTSWPHRDAQSWKEWLLYFSSVYPVSYKACKLFLVPLILIPITYWGKKKSLYHWGIYLSNLFCKGIQHLLQISIFSFTYSVLKSDLEGRNSDISQLLLLPYPLIQ